MKNDLEGASRQLLCNKWLGKASQMWHLSCYQRDKKETRMPRTAGMFQAKGSRQVQGLNKLSLHKEEKGQGYRVLMTAGKSRQGSNHRRSSRFIIRSTTHNFSLLNKKSRGSEM